MLRTVWIAVLVSASCCTASLPPEQQIDRFLDWLSSRQGKLTNVTMHSFPAPFGLGLLANGSLSEGTAVIDIPLQSVMSRDLALRTAMQCDKHEKQHTTADDGASKPRARKPIAPMLSQMQDEAIVAALVAAHALAGEYSDFAPYIDVLPRSVPAGFLFPDGAMSDTSVPGVAASAESEILQQLRTFRKKPLHAAIARLAEGIRSQNGGPELGSSMAPSCPVDASSLPSKWLRVAKASGKAGQRLRAGVPRACSLGLYLWASSVVSSRAMTIKGNKYMVPVADFHNHAPHPDKRDSGNGDRFLAFHSLRKDRFVVKADRATAPREQVFEDYGDSDPILFFVHHGFVAPIGGAGDCARVQLPGLESRIPVPGPDGLALPPPLLSHRKRQQGMDRKKRLLRKLGMPVGSTRQGPGHVCIPPAGEPQRWVWSYLRVHAMHLYDGGEHHAGCRGILEAGDGQKVGQEGWARCLGGSPRGAGQEGSRVLLGAVREQIRVLEEAAGVRKSKNAKEAGTSLKERSRLLWERAGAGKEQSKEREGEGETGASGAAIRAVVPEAEAAALLAELDVQQHTLLLRLGERLALAAGISGADSHGQGEGTFAGSGDSARGRVGKASGSQGRRRRRHRGLKQQDDGQDSGGKQASSPSTTARDGGRGQQTHTTEEVEAGIAGPASPLDAPVTQEEWVGVLDRLHAFLRRHGAGKADMPVEAEWVGGGMRVGVVAKQEVSKGAPYLRIPTSAIMGHDSAHGCTVLGPVFRQLRKKFPGGDHFHELLLHLLHESRVRGNDSEFAPYLATLPRPEEQTNPLVWEDSELEWLAGSPVHGEILQYRRQAASRYSGLRRVVFREFPGMFPAEDPGERGGPDAEAFSWHWYRWAYAILDSRSIWWKGQRHLVPLLDLVNCRQGPEGAPVHATREVEDSPEGPGHRGRRWAETLSPAGVLAGEQVFEDYGQPNHVYFMYHGFSLGTGAEGEGQGGNRHDCARVDVDARRLGPVLGEQGAVARVQRMVAQAQANGLDSLSPEDRQLVAGASEIVGSGVTLEEVADFWSESALKGRLQRAGFRSYLHSGCIGVDGGSVVQGHDGSLQAQRFVRAVLGLGEGDKDGQRARAVLAWGAVAALQRMQAGAGARGASIGEDEAELAGVADPPASAGATPRGHERRRLAVQFRLSQKQALRTVGEHWGLGWRLEDVGKQLRAGVFGGPLVASSGKKAARGNDKEDEEGGGKEEL